MVMYQTPFLPGKMWPPSLLTCDFRKPWNLFEVAIVETPLKKMPKIVQISLDRVG